MKKTIILILCLLAGAMLLDSCKKCATCTTTATVSCNEVPVPSATQTTTFDACGDDLKRMDGNESTQINYIAGKKYVTVSKTSCK